MEVIGTLEALRARLRGEPAIACVPTMGNIHQGHLSLVRIACEHAPLVVTTIFVNRLQFGANEDFDGYPRTFEDDCDSLERAGNAIVFHPNESQMYPEPQVFTVEPPAVANKLEGRFRPGHFRGVATVVLKLFNMVQPHYAVFGKKDYQQISIVRHMVEQLALPVRIIPAETVRADDGLALSSRNRYLTAEQRSEAPRLNSVLRRVREQVEAGDRNFEAIEFAADAELARHGWHVDYVVVRSRRTLMQPGARERELVVLGAAKLGNTRLIDNLEILAPA
ncbi:MAG: pantoate--beta-alanine ligase [Burkholderiales bacterium]|nr:pantoate--beta-alanine ligase [Burkholderiales bacterium]